MKSYLVTWSIDIEADSADEAAAQALIVQRDTESTATYFQVAEMDERTGQEVATFGIDLWDREHVA